MVISCLAHNKRARVHVGIKLKYVESARPGYVSEAATVTAVAVLVLVVVAAVAAQLLCSQCRVRRVPAR